MIAGVERQREEVAALCRKYGVRRLEVFGSAATGEGFDPDRSDLDFLVDFAPSHESLGPADRFFGLHEDLNRLFERKVDLLTSRSLRNPYLVASVNATRQTIYASEGPEAA